MKYNSAWIEVARNLGMWWTLENEYAKTAEERSVDNVLRRENPQQDQIWPARFLKRVKLEDDEVAKITKTKKRMFYTKQSGKIQKWLNPESTNQKVKNEEKLRKCSSSFARLTAPVKKPGRPKIQNFLMDELSEACNGHRAAEDDWIRLQLADAKESGNSATQYFEKMVYVDEGRTDGPRSLPHFSSLLIKVSLSKCCRDSEEFHDIRNQNSHEFASAIDCAFFVSFLPTDVTTHCRQQCLSAHLANSARHNSVTRFFFSELWPLHSHLWGQVANWRQLTFPECVIVIVIVIVVHHVLVS